MEWYFQLLNPLVFMIFAGGFVCIDRMRPSRAALVFAASYLVGSLAFLLDVLFEHSESIIVRTAIAGLYATTALLLVCGIWRHYRGPAPWRLLVGILICHLAVYGALLALEWPWMRSFSANFGCGIIFTFGLVAMHGQKHRFLDSLLFFVHSASCVLCFVRPVAIAFLTGEPLSSTTHSEEMLLVSLHLVVAASAVTTGMTLLVILSRDIFEDLKESSVRDPLTGLLNRRGFENEATALLQSRSDRTVSLIVADIDHFKAINDAHGHGTGDKVIAAAGQLMQTIAGPTGIVSRMGGEEFIVLLPDIDLIEASAHAQRMRTSMISLSVSDNADNLSCTASFGVAQYRTGEDLSSTIMRADHALYFAKTTGRDCVKTETDLAVRELNSLNQNDIGHESWKADASQDLA